jgi:hypothetical protein
MARAHGLRRIYRWAVLYFYVATKNTYVPDIKDGGDE